MTVANRAHIKFKDSSSSAPFPHLSIPQFIFPIPVFPLVSQTPPERFDEGTFADESDKENRGYRLCVRPVYDSDEFLAVVQKRLVILDRPGLVESIVTLHSGVFFILKKEKRGWVFALHKGCSYQ